MKDAADRPTLADLTRVRPVRKAGVMHQRAGQNVLLYDPAADKVHVLNPTAAAIWEHCDGCCTAEQIAARLAATFAHASDHDLIADVQAALMIFRGEGLLSAA